MTEATKLQLTHQQIADVIRSSLTETTELIIVALKSAPPQMTANEFGRMLDERFLDYVGELVHALDQAAAALADGEAR